jgi:hypothetical protein
MLLIEKYNWESDEEFESYLEGLYARVPTKLCASLETSLAKPRPYYVSPCAREWARPFRIGRRAGWSGRMFCETQCSFLRLYACVRDSVEEGIRRDALLIERRTGLGPREYPPRLIAVLTQCDERKVDLAEVEQLSCVPDETTRSFPDCRDDGAFRAVP